MSGSAKKVELSSSERWQLVETDLSTVAAKIGFERTRLILQAANSSPVELWSAVTGFSPDHHTGTAGAPNS